MPDQRFPFAYLILRFPKQSEQFILREVEALAEHFSPLLVFSLNEPEYALSPPSHIQVRYLNRRSRRSLLVSHGYLAFRFPVRYFRTLFKLVLIPFLRVQFSSHSRGKKQKSLKRTRQYLRGLTIGATCLRLGVAHIHAHYAHLPAETALRISKLTGIPFSFTAHAKDLFCTKKWRVAEAVRGASFVLTCTRDGQSYLKSILKSRHHGKIICVNHGLALERYRPEQSKPNRSGVPVILSAGRFIEKKGFDILLQALASLKQQGRSFRCILAGNGKLLNHLKELACSLGLESSVEFPGFLPETELSQNYFKADIFVLACRQTSDGNRDGIPNVLIEAMASGLPVISTRVGGVAEAVLDGLNGYITPPEDPVHLAKAVDDLLESSSMRDRMGRAGIRLAEEKFDLKVNTKILLNVFLKHCPNLREALKNDSRFSASRVQAEERSPRGLPSGDKG